MPPMSVEEFLMALAAVLVAAKVGSELFERLGQPPVLGELVAGILIGPSLLHLIDPHQPTLHLISELGAIFLLLEVGLDCELEELLQLGGPSLWVAIVGVATPFVLGYYAAHALGMSAMAAIFVGATLTATSVGITARVFSDLKRLRTSEARIVLGAAVADDVIGLVILAVVSGMASGAALTPGRLLSILGVALGFLVVAMVVGDRFAPVILRVARQMRSRGALGGFAAVFCFVVSALAAQAGLAPIVGAFAAGLVLARTEQRVHVTDALRPVADLFVPVFFVVMGASTLLNSLSPLTVAGRATLALAGVLLLVGVVGKVVAGLSMPWKGSHRLTIGVGMIPRGEVGLIFAGMGLSHHIIEPHVYAALLAVVMASTLVTPPLLKRLVLRSPEPSAA